VMSLVRPQGEAWLDPHAVITYGLLVLDACITYLTLHSTYHALKDRGNGGRLLPQRSEAHSTYRLIFYSAIAFMISSTVFNIIKTVSDTQHGWAVATGTGFDETSSNLHSALIVAFLVQSYLLLIAVSARLSIRIRATRISPSRSVLKVFVLTVPLLVFCLVGAAPSLGASLLVQQVCKILLLLIVDFSIVVLYARRFLALRVSAPELPVFETVPGPPLPGLSIKDTQSETDTKQDSNTVVMDRQHSEQEMLQTVVQRFVKQISWMVIVVVVILGVDIVVTMLEIRQQGVVGNKWVVLFTSLALSLHSVVTLRSIASSYAPKLCCCGSCRVSWRESHNDSIGGVDDQAPALPDSDEEGMHCTDYPSRTGLCREREGIQIQSAQTTGRLRSPQRMAVAAKDVELQSSTSILRDIPYIDGEFGDHSYPIGSHCPDVQPDWPSMDASHHHEPFSVTTSYSLQSEVVPPRRVPMMDFNNHFLNHHFLSSSGTESDHLPIWQY